MSRKAAAMSSSGKELFQARTLSLTSACRICTRVSKKSLSSAFVSASTTPIDLSVCTVRPPDSYSYSHQNSHSSGSHNHVQRVVSRDLAGAQACLVITTFCLLSQLLRFPRHSLAN